MTLFKEKYRIETTRLPGWDYSGAGCYFVTICTQGRMETLGSIESGKMHLSVPGEIAAQCWAEIPLHHAGVVLDEFAIMPNHLHGIIYLEGTDVETLHRNVSITESQKMSAISPKSGSLGVVVRSYKSAVSYITHHAGFQFGWQTRYWEHIIRNDAEFERIRQYIIHNPEKWEIDREIESGMWM